MEDNREFIFVYCPDCGQEPCIKLGEFTAMCAHCGCQFDPTPQIVPFGQAQPGNNEESEAP